MSETTLKNTYLVRERATQSLITPQTYYAQLAHRINHSPQFEHGRVKDKMPNVPSLQSFGKCVGPTWADVRRSVPITSCLIHR